MDKNKRNSLMTVTILGVSYKTVKSKKNCFRQTVVCKIRWINPINGNIQVTTGIATKNPDDEFSQTIGERLSESRAKINMYNTYMYHLGKAYRDAMNKHINLKYIEKKHQRIIKPSKNNNK